MTWTEGMAFGYWGTISRVYMRSTMAMNNLHSVCVHTIKMRCHSYALHESSQEHPHAVLRSKPPVTLVPCSVLLSFATRVVEIVLSGRSVFYGKETLWFIHCLDFANSIIINYFWHHTISDQISPRKQMLGTRDIKYSSPNFLLFLLAREMHHHQRRRGFCPWTQNTNRASLSLKGRSH